VVIDARRVCVGVVGARRGEEDVGVYCGDNISRDGVRLDCGDVVPSVLGLTSGTVGVPGESFDGVVGCIWGDNDCCH
jgi:hypothetical protein